MPGKQKIFECPVCDYRAPWPEFKNPHSLVGLSYRCRGCGHELYRVWNWAGPTAYLIFTVGLLLLWRIRGAVNVPLDVLWLIGFHTAYTHTEGLFIRELRVARPARKYLHCIFNVLVIAGGIALMVFGLSVFSTRAF